MQKQTFFLVSYFCLIGWQETKNLIFLFSVKLTEGLRDETFGSFIFINRVLCMKIRWSRNNTSIQETALLWIIVGTSRLPKQEVRYQQISESLTRHRVDTLSLCPLQAHAGSWRTLSDGVMKQRSQRSQWRRRVSLLVEHISPPK